MENVSTPQVERVKTRLKFIKSDKTGAIISFVSQNPRTGQVRGVRQEDSFPKKIAILDKKLTNEIFLNTLYEAELIPMTNKNGYVVIKADLVQFKAVVETTYLPKVIYKVEVKFGNKTIQFDPYTGRKETVRRLNQCRRLLETRLDIRNIHQVLEDFDDATFNLLKKYEQDGFIYNWK